MVDHEQNTNALTILFVCSGNTCRSPMAEALFREISRGRNIRVISAGVKVYSGDDPHATPPAIEAIQEVKGNLKDHRSQKLTPEMIASADCILGMNREHCRRILRMAPEAEGKVYLIKDFMEDPQKGDEVKDPYGKSLEVYRGCRDELSHALHRFYLYLLTKRVLANEEPVYSKEWGSKVHIPPHLSSRYYEFQKNSKFDNVGAIGQFKDQ